MQCILPGTLILTHSQLRSPFDVAVERSGPCDDATPISAKLYRLTGICRTLEPNRSFGELESQFFYLQSSATRPRAMPKKSVLACRCLTGCELVVSS